MICRWRENQLFAEELICEPLTRHDILREPSTIIVLSFSFNVSYNISYKSL